MRSLIILFGILATVIAAKGLDSLAPQSVELDRGVSSLVDNDNRRSFYPPRRPNVKLFEEVVINDPQEKSAGIYLRVSQKGANYLTYVVSKGLPSLLTHLVLPKVQASGFTAENFVITSIAEPDINATFINATGVSLRIMIPKLTVEGDCEMDLFFSARGHLLATVKNWTVEMDVSIERELGAERNNITVTKCDGKVPVSLQFFGEDADSLNAFSDMIGDYVEDAVKDKLCILPGMINAFLEQQQEEILSEQFWNDTHIAEQAGAVGPKIEDHICSDLFGTAEEDTTSEPLADYADEQGALEGFGSQLSDIGTWAPDLTMRFPPTFSDKDLIFGIDGGIVLNGLTARIERPRFANVTVVRDQMAGLIVSEYVPNAFLYHIFEKSLGSFVESFNLRHVPKSLRPFARVVCSDCMVILKANLTQRPHVAIDRNGIVLLIEGDIGAHFYRKNKTHELLSADGVIRVVLKPQFRHSRVYSDVELTGVDFKVYKLGINGLFANGARKLLNFIIPRAIWPRVQKSLRFAINRRGIKLPTVCGIQFEKLHVDYIRHAAILSADFTVDVPFFIQSFKQFLEADLKHYDGIDEYDKKFRYL